MNPSFAGWYRLYPGPWQPYCDGATEKECWQRLLLLRVAGGQIDKVVLPTGTDPNKIRRPR